MTDIDPTATAFTGFDERAVAFYLGLEADNSRSYFTDHKGVYDDLVKAPMLALLAQAEPEFGPGKMFRPHRDVRFSKDKSPYKDHQGAVISEDGGQGTLYVQLSGDGLLVGGGYYQLSPDQLVRYREAVLDDASGAALAGVTGRLVAEGFELMGELLKRAPRGVPVDHPRVDLLRHKGLAVGRHFGTPDWLGSAQCADEIFACWRQTQALTGWLATHVGPAEGDDEVSRAARARV